MNIFDGPESIKDAAVPWKDIVRDDYHVTVYRDAYPVTPGHLLFVPKYNTITVLCEAFHDAVIRGKRMVETGECDGFNLGMNFGRAGGQTVIWPHIHLIPRRQGDVDEPMGGVRNVIPGKGKYK